MTERVLGPSGSKRRKTRFLVLTALVGAALAVFFVTASSANLAGSTFEGNDGNLIVNGGALAKDWANAPNLSAGQDLQSGGGDNSFGNGTQENDVNVTVVDGSIPNSKADLARFAVAGETIGANSFLYLAWSRENDSGSVNYDFEINKLAQPSLLTLGPKTLNRSEGDLNISYSFQGNSLVPALSLRTWDGSEWGDPQSLTGCSEGLANAATVSDTLTSPAVDRPQGRFGEAAVNLTCAGIVPEGGCDAFSSAYIKSRASQSFQSEIKDFIAPVALSLSNCGAIEVTKTTKIPGTVGPQPQAGVSFAVDGGTAQATGSNGKICFGGLALGNHSVAETVPTGYQADGDNPKIVNVAAAGTCASGATAVSFSNTPLTDVTITVNSQADGGTANSINCEGVAGQADPADGLDKTSAANGDIASNTVTGLLPQEITCTIVIDP